MSRQPPNEKPPWLSTVPGQPQAFNQLDKAEAEKQALAAIADARRFVESPVAAYASRSQKFLADADRRRITTREQLTLAPLFLQRGQIAEWRDIIIHHVRALRDLGRFDEARGIIAGAAAAHDLDSWLADVNETEAACQRDEDYDCGCEREQATVEDAHGREQPLELDRRFQKREFTFCPYRGKTMPLYECRHCEQRSVGVPEKQKDYEQHRRSHEINVRAAIARGEMVPAAKGDHLILKSLGK